MIIIQPKVDPSAWDRDPAPTIYDVPAAWQDGLVMEAEITSPPSMRSRAALICIPHDQIPALLRLAREQAIEARMQSEHGAAS